MSLDTIGPSLYSYLIEEIGEETYPPIAGLEILLLEIHTFGLRCCISMGSHETEGILGRKDDAVWPNQLYSYEFP